MGGAKPPRVAGFFARTEKLLLSYHSSPARAAATVCEVPAGSPSVPAAGAPPDDAVKYIGGARDFQHWEEDGASGSPRSVFLVAFVFFDAAVSTRADLIHFF